MVSKIRNLIFFELRLICCLAGQYFEVAEKCSGKGFLRSINHKTYRLDHVISFLVSLKSNTSCDTGASPPLQTPTVIRHSPVGTTGGIQSASGAYPAPSTFPWGTDKTPEHLYRPSACWCDRPRCTETRDVLQPCTGRPSCGAASWGIR